MTEYLLDTWAWIEYFEGSQIGKKIDQVLKSDQKVYTSIVSLAELSDNYHRKELITGYSWEEVQTFIEKNSEIIEVRPHIAAQAGRTKSKEREDMKDFGLMDAIILETGREKDLTLISGDKHLKNKKLAEKIEE
jgi:PIN domain nuclease of toxin-antitoxin system